MEEGLLTGGAVAATGLGDPSKAAVQEAKSGAEIVGIRQATVIVEPPHMEGAEGRDHYTLRNGTGRTTGGAGSFSLKERCFPSPSPALSAQTFICRSESAMKIPMDSHTSLIFEGLSFWRFAKVVAAISFIMSSRSQNTGICGFSRFWGLRGSLLLSTQEGMVTLPTVDGSFWLP